MKVAIAKIQVPDNRRQLRGVEELMGSISELGLLNPITVTEDLRLIAGYHRLEACKRLGWTEIEANVVTFDELDAELAEIDENLIRNELTELERAEALARRKEIYEAKHPEAKAEERKKANLKQYRSETVSLRESFTTDTAAKTGLTPRTIQQDIQIATRIAPDVRDQIRETPLADSKRELLELARMDPEQQRQVLALNEKEILKIAKEIRARKAEERRAQRFERLREMSENNPELTPAMGKYPILYADPPWQYEHLVSVSREIEEHYPTMAIEDICALPIQDITTDDAMLFLWVPPSLIEKGLEVVRAWGFKYRTCMVWDKQKIGMGYYTRQQHELLFIASKGDPIVPAPNTLSPSVVSSPRKEHSAKPDVFYEIIERMYPGLPKIELFARNTREGWATWGNEVNRHERVCQG